NVLWNLDLADGVRDGRATRATAGNGAVIYVVDTGVDASHDEFRRDDGTSSVIAGLDPVGEYATDGVPANCLIDNALAPCWEPFTLGIFTHGTAVASVAAGRTAGVAPGASIVAVRVLGARKLSVWQDELWLRALDDIVAHAATQPFRTAIVNMSASPGFAVTNSRWPDLEQKMRAMIDGVGGKRFFFVIAAGNAGQCATDGGVLYYPGAAGASIDGAITVGGVDREGRFWSGSCGGRGVEILAPAEALLCASISGHDRYRGTFEVAPGTAQDVASGTSYAAPYVAGIAARMLELEPELTPVELERRIKASAMHVLGDGPA